MSDLDPYRQAMVDLQMGYYDDLRELDYPLWVRRIRRWLEKISRGRFFS